MIYRLHVKIRTAIERLVERLNKRFPNGNGSTTETGLN